MGLFDNLFETIESGALEKRLNQFADAIDKNSEQVEDKLHAATGQGRKNSKTSKVAAPKKPATKKRAAPRAKGMPKQAGIHMDIIRGKQ